MVDVTASNSLIETKGRPRSALRNWFGRKSTVAFFMALPLIVLIICIRLPLETVGKDG